jgi:hypothetical protein
MAVLDSSSLHRFLVHFTETLTPELAFHFSKTPFDPEFQQRLDDLGCKANEGILSGNEQREYDTFPNTFAGRSGWKNDPMLVTLLGLEE